jgi:hypothetical protein
MNYSELETRAYLAGDTATAELLDRIAFLESEVDRLEAQIDDTTTLEQWEDNNGPADAYKAFFEGCFERLDGHYPCASVTSDYDCSVIFDAISKGESK